MLTPETIEKMNAMKLFGLVSAFETQLSSSEYKELSFEERVGLLVDAEWTAREQRKLSRRLRAAKLRYPACLENVNFQAPRGYCQVDVERANLSRRADFLCSHRTAQVTSCQTMKARSRSSR